METSTIKDKKIISQLFLCKNYTVLLIANFISRFGDSVDSIAYGWMVYMLTGSKILLGSIFAVNAIPNIVFGPFAGVLADRLDKRKLVIMSYIGRGLIVSVTALLFLMGQLHVWHLFLFTTLNSTLETLMSPAVMSIMPLILQKDQFLSANSFATSAYKFAELIGTALAGAIIALLGISGAIFIDAGTFFFAGFLMIFMNLPKDEVKAEKMNIKNYVEDLKVGFIYVKENKLIRNVLILFAIINFGLSPISVLLPVFTKDILKGGAETLSYIGVAISLGTILGGLIIGKFGSKVKMTLLIIIGFFVMGITYALMYLPGNIVGIGQSATILTISCFFVFGFVMPVVSAPIQSYFMMNTEKQIIGRVSSFMVMITYATIPLGNALTGVVTEYVSMSLLFLIMGIFICLVSISLKVFKILETDKAV